MEILADRVAWRIAKGDVDAGDESDVSEGPVVGWLKALLKFGLVEIRDIRIGVGLGEPFNVFDVDHLKPEVLGGHGDGCDASCG